MICFFLSALPFLSALLLLEQLIRAGIDSLAFLPFVFIVIISTTHSVYLVSFGILFPVETVPQADRRTPPPQGLISNHVPIYSLLIEGTRVGANESTVSIHPHVSYLLFSFPHLF